VFTAAAFAIVLITYYNGTNAGGLNAILYNNTTGVVAAVAAIAADGTYSISSTATSGNSFTVYITTNNPAIGSAAVPPVVLPVGWGNTGEYFGSGAGNDGTPNGVPRRAFARRP